MGIKDFLKIVYNGKTLREYGYVCDDKYLHGKKIAVDAFNLIYRNRFATENLSFEGKITSHIKITLTQILKFKKLGCEQMWVFDGGHNPLKAETQSKRTVKITREEVADIKKLLSWAGIKYITTETEAEFFCAELTKKGVFDYVLSSDMDVIVRGGNILKAEKKNYLCLHSDEIGLSQEELARIAVHMGCDFAPKTKGIGPLSVIKKISTQLTERQILAFDFLMAPTNMKILEKPETKSNLEELKKWLLELGFSKKTINSF